MSEQIRSRKIMFSGGGSGGSVTPLLAVAEKLLAEDAAPTDMKLELLFVGTKTGPEKKMVADFSDQIRFIPLISGKWRRYFSWANFLDIFKIGAAFFQSLAILTREKPAIVISAGSFVSVPLAWAAAFKKIPVLIHQQDVRPGLANRLMAPYARAVTVTFENSLGDYGAKAVWIGNPISDIEKHQSAVGGIKAKYELKTGWPLMLVTGGGTGASAVNKLILQALSGLTAFCQVIHLTGKGKLTPALTEIAAKNPRYQVFDFLPNEEVLSLMAVADLVISRCGIATLTELAALGKPAILIPMPDTHQEDNAAVFAAANAALVLDQKELTPERLVAAVKNILSDSERRERFQNNIGKVIKRDAAENFTGIVWEMIK